MKLKALAAVALAASAPSVLAAQLRDVEDIGMPEETPVIHGRMFRSLDESQSFYDTADAASQVQEVLDSSANHIAYVLPLAAVAVGVAGVATYKRTNQCGEHKFLV